MPVAKTIPLHLIDEPEVAMRSDIPDQYIAELAADIERNGLINPVTVTKVGQRYLIHAGHCRLLAHQHLKREHIECRDYTDDTVNLEALKFSENKRRLDVSDADMAIYLDDLCKKYNYNMDQLMAITGEKEYWINQRLALLRGDQQVFLALQAEKIKLGHAIALNRFPDEFRAMYLAICIDTTPPIRMVAEWLAKLKLQHSAPLPENAVTADGAPAPSLPGVILDSCELCKGTEMNWTMNFHRIHDHCFEVIKKAMAEAGSQ